MVSIKKEEREKLLQVTSEIFLSDTPKEDDPWRMVQYWLQEKGFPLKMSETSQVPQTISYNHVISHLQTWSHLGS